MTADRLAAGAVPASVPPPSLEERLERGEILCFPRCPFALPEEDDRSFLRQQRVGRWRHKNICYNPHAHRVTGFRCGSGQQADRLTRLLAGFSVAATTWLHSALPRYARGMQPDRASLQPEEEATRRLRLTARNDLLHVDAFPSRPTFGRRILRLFVNINPVEPRVWATSASFARLLARYGAAVGLPEPGQPLTGRPRGLRLLFQRALGGSCPYDRFMLRLHDFLKLDDDFQERASRQFWSFPPGSAWLAFTDGLAHAVLRGCHALEHSYFVASEDLVLPDEAPSAQLARFIGAPPADRAA